MVSACTVIPPLAKVTLQVASSPHHIPEEHPEDQGSFIPCFVHSDGGEVYNSCEYIIWSWSSCLVMGRNTWDFKLFIGMVPDHMRYNHVTDEEIIFYIWWNFEVLESKRHPSVDHLGRPLTGRRAALAGTPIAGAWGASFVAHISDLKERVRIHRFIRYYQCNFLCEKCLGHRWASWANAYDFSDSAKWRELEVTHESYLLSTPPGSRSPFCRFRSWTIHRNKGDLLHNCWLGFSKDVSGQMLFEIASMYMSPDLSYNLALLHQQMIAWYREQGVYCGVRLFRLTTLQWENNRDYPTLESQMKGAHSKMVFMFVAWLAVQIVESGTDTSPHAKLRATCAWALRDVIYVLDRHGRWLPQDAADQVYDHGNLFLTAYQRLAGIALSESKAWYKLRPKFHDFAHLLIDIKRCRENPKQRDLFDSEDFIGKIKKLAAACHKRHVDVAVCYRLILFLGWRWHNASLRAS